jgi:UDPglucose--hexose-1-phosphate uridylyltransferase
VTQARTDPLDGTRVLVGDGPAGAYASRQLHRAAEVEVAAEELPLGAPLAELGADGVRSALEGLRRRMRAHAGAAYVHAHAREASIHLHALGFVPAAVARERERFAAYAAANYGANLLQDLVQEEVKLGDRLVAYDDEAVLLAAFAPRASHHLLVVPRRPAPRFEDDGPTGAALLHDALRRLARPADVWVRTAPQGADPFCWHIDVVPAAAPDGLERGAGLAVVPVAPEQAAAELRG